MPAENIASVTALFKYSIGGRTAVVGEAKFPTKYKTEGCELSAKQIEELGLPDAIVDWGAIVTTGIKAKNAEVAPMQLNITNPGLNKAEPQKVKIQAYECIKEASLKELASESEVTKEAVPLVLLVGR